ncbi:DsbA family protein [Agaribacterium haliotis]|jgi:protein-disulfide isomerase|uniref:DsbA family protein n=1 Tax=Agaribacterium haliotis TaxID=2013869 RepID=UPI000BB57289|nr:thioredoxin domain-containing protein [Agaribacterium haliotis]EKO3631374.1 thioredoxin domain-containing protein [Vibrio metschnikovii]EKO3669571.1 thioredoxin domain-containing protein [Vibrio metschnikovii]EKO3728422.1 thioredoxin domain-containing protein [Vibrio metschnikovii]
MAIPIPNRPSGYLLGDPAAAITLDAFIDIQCPHSRQAWPTLLAVMEHYQDKPVSLRVHLITLSNHRQAWDVSLGLFALADGDARKFYDFATYVYERQEQFYNAPFLHKTHDDLRQFVADLAQAHSDVNRDAFLKKMVSHDIYIDARTPIRYAATKSVWATPTFFVNNGDKVSVDHSSTLDNWKELIDPLLSL